VSLTDEIRRCYDALNRGDPQPFLELYDPQIELYVPEWAGLDAGLYRGADAVNRWYANYFAQWSNQHWELVESLEQGPSVAFVMDWRATGRRSGVALNGRIMVVMTFSEGRLMTIAHFGYEQLLER
jgi:ketosteroid isomerase-like protein